MRKVVMITGASRGIGKATALTFARAGFDVAITARTEVEGQLSDHALTTADGQPLPGSLATTMAELAALGVRALAVPMNLLDTTSVDSAAERVLTEFGRVDVLINNAGVSQRSLALDTDFETYQRIMDIDYFAPLRLTQLVLPHMVDRGSGTFVAISSLAGRIGSCMRTGYCSAKFALLGYYEALRAEVDAAYGVKVLTVLPGSVRTAVAANALQGDGSQRGVSDANIDGGMDPDDVARQIVAAIKTGKRDLVIAEGGEMGAYQMRMSDPERLYDGVAREGVRMAAQRAAAGEGQALILDPSRNR